MLGMTVFLLGNNMTALYDHVLKMISNGLGKCIILLMKVYFMRVREYPCL